MSLSLHTYKFKLSDNAVRRSLMVLLALIMTHLITYQQLPFSTGYQFPIIPFSIFFIYGLFICETNTWNYRRLFRNTRLKYDMRSVWKVVSTNVLYCSLIFLVLTIVQMLVFQYVMNPFRFVGLLSVCLMISTIETGVFIVRAYAKSKSPTTLNKIASRDLEIAIVRNDELRRFEESEIALFMHKDGCVFLIDKNGKRFTTQFESLSELEGKVSGRFFRATRQALISKDAIHSLRKDINNKLKVQLFHLDESLTVSRYKSPELKAWYAS